MTWPYSIAFKRKMVEPTIGKDAVSAIQIWPERSTFDSRACRNAG